MQLYLVKAIASVATEIIGTDHFRAWYQGLSLEAQERVAFVVELLGEHGVALGHSYSSEIKGSVLALRELRTQYMGEPYRILYVFDPVRQAVLLVGGNKGGKGSRWYAPAIKLAGRLYPST